MLKNLIVCFFLSIISLPVFASDNLNNGPFDAIVRYHAACSTNKYEECAKNNEQFTIKNMSEDSTILDLKDRIFNQKEKDPKFAPAEQVITCERAWLTDDSIIDTIDACWDAAYNENFDENQALFTLHLKQKLIPKL